MAGALGQAVPRFTVLQDGVPVPGAKVYFTLSGTSTPHPVYTTSALSVELSNPVEADGTGLLPAIYFDDVAYRVLVTDADGATVIPTQDGVYDFGQLYAVTKDANGDVVIPRDLTVTRDLTVGDDLTVVGDSGLQAVTVGGTLAVTGISTFTADVRTTAWTDYGATSTITGWSALTTQKIFYKKLGKLVYVAFQLEGTSNATSATFTLPVARSTDAGFTLTAPMGGDIQNNGAAVTVASYLSLPSASSTVTLVLSSGAWTGSSGKRAAGEFFYEAAS
jgi:hypothetical protein